MAPPWIERPSTLAASQRVRRSCSLARHDTSTDLAALLTCAPWRGAFCRPAAAAARRPCA
eukprot:366000-Chlamydomonas_euryale.AAC.68